MDVIMDSVVPKLNHYSDFCYYVKIDDCYRTTNWMQFSPGKCEMDGEDITIQRGYQWDISCPKCMKWYCENDKVAKAALIHDYLLDNGYVASYADGEFYRALRATGCSIAYSTSLWAAVRAYSTFSKIKIF